MTDIDVRIDQVDTWRLIGGLLIAGVAIWLLMRTLEWREIGIALARADYRWVAVGVLAILGTFVTRTRRWQTLLWQARVRFWPAMTALLVGQVLNLALPMRSGDAVRAMWISPEEGAGTTEALASIAVEKMWDLFALVATGLLILVWLPLPDWFARSTWGTAAVLAVGSVALWTGLHWRESVLRRASTVLRYLPAGWDTSVLHQLHRFADGLEAVRRPAVSTRALLWTLLTWGFGAAANLAVLAAFGTASVLSALFLLAALMVGGAVPVPGRLGLFEGITVVSLALFGVPGDQALAIGVVLHVVVMGPPLIVAALLAFWPRLSDREPHDIT